jgi:hypothetical protein
MEPRYRFCKVAGARGAEEAEEVRDEEVRNKEEGNWEENWSQEKIRSQEKGRSHKEDGGKEVDTQGNT